MLKSLRVKDFALIDDIGLDFIGGLNVLTGETGAGKSLVVDCLALVSGSRADAQFVKKGKEAAVIEAAFDITCDPFAKEALRRMGIVLEGGSVVLSREVYSSGGSRARIDGKLVTAGELAQAAEVLMDIFGQNETQKMLKPQYQLAAVDAFLEGAKAELLQEVGAAYSRWRSAEEELAKLMAKAEDRQARLDFLGYQVDELEEAAVEPGEEARLMAEAKVLANASRIYECMQKAYGMLYDSGFDAKSAIDLARSASEELEAAAKLGFELQGGKEALEAAADSMRSVAEDALRARDALDMDPERASVVESRLADIGRMKRKYRMEADELAGFLDSCRKEMEELKDLEIRTGSAAGMAEAARRAMLAVMEELSLARQHAAKRLSSSVEEQLKELMMPRARFYAKLMPRTAVNGTDAKEGRFASASGLEVFEFYFSANVGEEPMPLAKVASGGELSRFMLAFKVASSIAGEGALAMVFDEIDQGVGGAAANHVALKLKQVSEAGQAIVVTHLAQIAAAADRHVTVTKSDDGTRAVVQAKALTDGDRVLELARMLSGTDDKEAVKHASTMLKSWTKGQGGNKEQGPATKQEVNTFSLFK